MNTTHQFYTLPPNTLRQFEAGLRTTRPEPERPSETRVSVITVVLNAAQTVQRCIDSVRSQSGVAIEHIVIDGGSTDGTLAILQANAHALEYVVSEPDRGIYDAMNKGISLASGDFIALINADDWLEPGGLDASIQNILSSGADASIGYANVWNKDGAFSHIWKIGNFDVRILTSGMTFCHQAVVVSRRAFDLVGPFDHTIWLSADYKWLKQLYLSGLTAVFTEKVIVNFSFDGAAANNRIAWKAECKDILTDQFPFLAKSDVSAHLEYIYRDVALDQNATANLIMQAGSSPLLLQSLALVLLDRLLQLELERGNVVAAAKRNDRKPHARALLSIEKPAALPQSPKISVILPIYNVEAYLEECLRSVMAQSITDIEIICVDDGSPDNSYAILERLASEDRRIKIVRKKNGGLSSARNAGVAVAKGRYIHFLDSDDYILPGMYEALYAQADEFDLDIVKSNLGFVNDVYPVKRPPLPKGVSAFAFGQCPDTAQYISPCSALYARALLRRCSPFSEGMTYEDRPFNWETLLRAKRIGHVDQVFYMYRVDRPGSIMSSRKGNRRHFDAFRAVDHIRSLLKQTKRYEEFRLEFVKEQLRVYSMLIDIDAIPRKDYGEFYWHMWERLNAAAVPHVHVDATNLPPRVKDLYAFFVAGSSRSDAALEGESYFFKGMGYKAAGNRYLGSACELFLIAEYAVQNLLGIDGSDFLSVLRRSALVATMFDEIHSGDIELVADVRAALNSLVPLVSESAEFLELAAALDRPTPADNRAHARHLAFQYSMAPNYAACRAVLEEYFSERNIPGHIIGSDTLNNFVPPVEVSAALRIVVERIKQLSIRPYALSQIVALVSYVAETLDLSRLETFTSFFLNSPPERYLYELLSARCRTVLLPHGLPQVSLATTPPDVLLALSQSNDWEQVFPDSDTFFAGWPEAVSPSPARVREAGTRRTVLFLSQIEGSKVHKLEDFILLTNEYLAAILSPELASIDFNIRLRKQAELAQLDAELVGIAMARANISFSTVSDGPMSSLAPDIIVSSTSTGMLFGEHWGIPTVQLVTERLFAHWPFRLAEEANCIALSDVRIALPPLLLRLAPSEIENGQLDGMPAARRMAVLDAVYLDPAHSTAEPDFVYRARRSTALPARAVFASWATSALVGNRLRPTATWRVSEERVFREDLQFLNLAVSGFMTQSGTLKPFHVKLLRVGNASALELSEQDGGFSLLGFPNEDRVIADDWGRKIILYADAEKRWVGAEAKDIAQDISALRAFLTELPLGVDSCANLSDHWKAGARHLAAAFQANEARTTLLPPRAIQEIVVDEIDRLGPIGPVALSSLLHHDLKICREQLEELLHRLSVETGVSLDLDCAKFAVGTSIENDRLWDDSVERLSVGDIVALIEDRLAY